MADIVPSRSAILAACVALLALSGCTASPSLATPSPAPSRSSTDRGTPSPAASGPTVPAASVGPGTGSASPATSSTPSALADVPGRGTAVPAPAPPAPLSPALGQVEITGDVRAFIDAAYAVASRGEAVTAASLAAASPQAAALLAAGRARVTGEALLVFVSYEVDPGAARAAVEAAGGVVERTAPESRVVQAAVPVTRLPALTHSTAITRIRLPETSVR